MPPRSRPSVSGVVPSIQSWTQSSGCSAARSCRFSLTGPSANPRRLGKLPEPDRSLPWQALHGGETSETRASPTAGSGPALADGGSWLLPGPTKGGLSPVRLEARYTPPTRKTKTVSPIAQAGRPELRVSIGVWTVIGSVSGAGRCRLAGRDVCDGPCARVHEEQVRQHGQARQ